MKKEVKEQLVKLAREIAGQYGVKVALKNIVLLESGGSENEVSLSTIDYIMFEDKASGKQYQYYGGEHPSFNEYREMTEEEIIEATRKTETAEETNEEKKEEENSSDSSNNSKKSGGKEMKKSTSKKEIKVMLKAFTGMEIGEYTATVERNKYVVIAKKGQLTFDKKTLKQTDAKSPRFANYLQILDK